MRSTRLALATICLAAAAAAGVAGGSARAGGVPDEPFFPGAGNRGYDALDYRVRVAYRPAGRIKASTTITAIATFRLERFSLDFLGPRVTRVSVGGEPARFDRPPGKLRIRPPGPIEAGSRFEVEVGYLGTPPTIVSEIGPVLSAHTGPGLLGEFLVVQTNFLPAGEPLSVTAVSTRDDRRVFRVRPFPDSTASWIVSKPALDAANRTVISHDTSAGRMAALRLDPRRGFSVRWRRPLSSLAFSALVGPPAARQIVIPDRGEAGESVLWLDERSGRVRARSEVLSPQSAPGNIVTPGFGGRFYYLSGEGALWELKAARAR